MAKLTPELTQRMELMLRMNIPVPRIAKEIGVTTKTVHALRKKLGIPVRVRTKEERKNTESHDASNICWDCKNATGFCPWCEVDHDTGRIKYAPVPGWTTEKVWMNGEVRERIVACPLFERG